MMNKETNMKQNEYEVYFSIEDSNMKIMWITATTMDEAISMFRQKYPCKVSVTIHEVDEYI